MRLRSILAGAAFAGALALPGVAAAATAYATGDVNLRAGPGTNYPVATVVDAGAPVNVFGCLTGYSWCDVSFNGVRGWVSGRYLEQAYAGDRVLVPAYGARIGVPVISFSFGNYWDDHYRGRSFYRDRDRYDDRREARQDRRQIQRERAQFQDRRDRINDRIADAETREQRQRLRNRRQEARENFREEREDITCAPGGRRCIRN